MCCLIKQNTGDGFPSGTRFFAGYYDRGGLLSGYNLAPGDYFLVLDVRPPTTSGARPIARWSATQSDNEDTGAKPGFSIANTHLIRPHAGPNANTWVNNLVASSLQMRLNGEAVPVTNLSVKQIALSNSFVEAGDVVFQVSLDKTNRKNFKFQTCFTSSAASLGGTVYERLSDYPNFTCSCKAIMSPVSNSGMSLYPQKSMRMSGYGMGDDERARVEPRGGFSASR